MYFIDYENQSLMHYGVKGMKWGVRKEELKFGSSKRTRAKEAHVRKKREISETRGLLGIRGLHNIANDYRRGREKTLRIKAEHREAKENYKANKTSSNKKDLNTARINRTKHVATTALINPQFRGAYRRNRDQGHTAVGSFLRSYGTSYINAFVYPINLGQIAAQNLSITSNKHMYGR